MKEIEIDAPDDGHMGFGTWRDVEISLTVGVMRLVVYDGSWWNDDDGVHPTEKETYGPQAA